MKSEIKSEIKNEKIEYRIKSLPWQTLYSVLGSFNLLLVRDI
jgi:hypothetical protein